MNKIDGQKVRQFAKGLGEVVICSLLILSSCIRTKNERTKPVGYDVVVEAIMSSSMFSSDKCEAVKLLKRGMDDEYYKSVLSVVNSTMFGSERVQMIRYLSGE